MPNTSDHLTSGRKPDDAVGYLPRKSFDVEFKELSDDGSFTLYAAMFGNVDRQGDLIEPGAFDNLAEFVRDGWIALNHDQKALPLAYPTAAIQDGRGLLISGSFHSHAEAQAVRAVARERMAAGKAVKASIGYSSNDESYERQGAKTIRRIKRLSIYEASFVNLPANPAAEVQQVKGASMPEVEDKGSILDALKELLGLATKGGRALSKANHTRLKSFAEAMDEHGKAAAAHGKAGCKMAAEMHKFLKPYDPDGGDDEGDDEDGPEAKGEGPPPPKQLTEADRNRLKLRSMVGRQPFECP